MSEHQWIEIRAINSPLDDAAVKFMRSQSTRASIDRWSFQNEYHYDDFGGDALEMLKRGDDLVHHYSNFENRSVWMRCRNGFA